MVREPTFEVRTDEGVDVGETLVVGVADVGVAGLTAVDYLTNHVETEQIGYVQTRNVPDLTPFSEGKPRHPMRLYDATGTDVTMFVSEVYLPVWAADTMTDSLFAWASDNGVEEILVLFGVSVPHQESEHVVFHVGTEPFRERMADTGIDPLPGGFFEGTVGELVTRGLETNAPAVGVLVTPAHFPGPDLDGAIRLLDGFETVTDIAVDESELRARSAEMKRYYEDLASRMQSQQESDQSIEYPEDRMYM